MMAAPFIIAVVDDDRRILESLGNLLESADYAVRLFSTATALLDSGCLARIDCLITDIGLPLMDGVELARLVQVARPELPTILITGQFETLDRFSAVGLGPYRLFKKPFDGQEVLTAISDVLRGARLGTAQG
jgi:FixJ family two-component response regulator